MNLDTIRSKMNGRKLGVVMPCHNYGRYLAKCIQSLYDQTIVPDQIILVDDSSTDNTKQVCDQFPGVIYKRVEFKHANRSRNYGVQLLKDCDFLLLFDPDNYMMPTMVQKMFSYLLENPEAAYAYSDRIIIDDRDIIGKRVMFPEFDAKIFESTNFIDFASMMHRKVYDVLGGLTEVEEFSALEDWDFFYAAANLGFEGIHIPEPLYYYRTHPVSKSIYLRDHPYKFQSLKRTILERNYIGFVKKENVPSVSFVFASRTDAEALNTIKELRKQRYCGKVEYCYSTEGTIPHALNKALARAENDIIVFTETDVTPHDPDWLRQLLYKLNPGAIVFSNEVTHTWYNWAGTAVYKDDLGDLKLDEAYPIAEDTEYFERLKLERGLTLLRSNAIVYHRKEHETQKALSRAREYGYLHAKLIEQYHYFPMDQYKKRLELQLQIAKETLEGINQYENEHSKSLFDCTSLV